MEYHKIETLYERDAETHKLNPALILKNRIYSVIKTWHFTEKIDGTNIRCIWENGKLTFGGKTDRAQLSADLLNYLNATITPEKIKAIFPLANEKETDAIIYGEGYGAGIQKGGDYSSVKRFIVFDVLVNHKWWLNWENVCDVALKLNLPTVPYVGEMTLQEATEMVKSGFLSAFNNGKKKAEGLVGRPIETLFDKKGHRLIIKLKTKDF